MTGTAFELGLEDIGLLDCGGGSEFDDMTAVATRLLDVPVSLVSIVAPERNRQYFASLQGLPEPFASARQTPLSHSFCKHVLARREPLVVEDPRLDPRVRDSKAVHALNIIAYLAVPIRGPDQEVVGAFFAIDDKPRSWSRQDMDDVQRLASAVNAQILLRAALRAREMKVEELEMEVAARRRAERRLKRLATTDPLTGALNRRALFERAEAEIARTRRYGSPLGVLMIDLDGFKAINDRFGHGNGDRVLLEACRRMKSAVRKNIDIFARLGGDEFCLLLPESDAAACESAAERLRTALSSQPLALVGEGDVSVTCSVGISILDPQDDNFAALIKRADRAVYQAKAAGRDCSRVQAAGTADAGGTVPIGASLAAD